MGAVVVDIYDQIYQLRGVNPEYIERLASVVDSKMRAVSAHGATVDSLRVAVLAALNLADELVTLRGRYDVAERVGGGEPAGGGAEHGADACGIVDGDAGRGAGRAQGWLRQAKQSVLRGRLCWRWGRLRVADREIACSGDNPGG